MKIRCCGTPAAIFRDRLREPRDGSRQFVTYDWRQWGCAIVVNRYTFASVLRAAFKRNNGGGVNLEKATARPPFKLSRGK